jgi:hypothetical protein
VTSTKADGVPLFCVSLAGEDVIWEESLLEIASFVLSVAILGLNACLRSQFLLYKGVEDVILLVISLCENRPCQNG